VGTSTEIYDYIVICPMGRTFHFRARSKKNSVTDVVADVKNLI
jgi:hypothetical protein